jgi:hypothetical protein
MPTTQESKIDYVALAKDHADQWVAVDPSTGAILAAGSSAREVLDLAVEAGVQDPIVTYVRRDYSIYIPCLTE